MRYDNRQYEHFHFLVTTLDAEQAYFAAGSAEDDSKFKYAALIESKAEKEYEGHSDESPIDALSKAFASYRKEELNATNTGTTQGSAST